MTILPANEYSWHFLQALWRHPDTGTVPDVEAQRLVRPVLQQLHPSTRLWHQVHVDDGRHLAELFGVAYPQVVLLAVLRRAPEDRVL